MIVVLFLSSFSFGQKNDSLKLVDEFGGTPLDELMARLDGAVTEFYSALPENPNGKLRVRIYGGIADSFVSAHYNGSNIEGYLKNNRHVKPEDFSIEYCNVNKEALRTQIYVASQGESLPECENNLEVPTKKTRFSTIRFYDPEFKFVATEDSVPEFGFSQGEYSRAAFNVLKSFAENSPENKIYVISYLRAYFEEDENGKITKKKIDKKPLAAKMLRAAKDELIKNGFNNSQIKLVEGGYSKGIEVRRVEIYFVPKNGEIPKPKPDYLPKNKE